MSRDKSENIGTIETKLTMITREFLSELGRERSQNAISLKASFSRELGIDSLGKVELFHRVEDAFNLQLSEQTMIQADTLEDLATAILNSTDFVHKTTERKIFAINSVTNYDPMTAKTLIDVLWQRAAFEPDRTHIYFQDEFMEEKAISYDDLLNRSLEIAAGLQNQGIVEGETVAIMLPTCEDFFYTFFGILLIGAIPVPIYPPLRADRIEEYAMRASGILKNAQARLLITFHQVERLSELLKVFILSLKAVVTVDALKNNSKQIAPILLHGQMPALIQYTSGSTSAPKGVLLSHDNLLANIRAIGEKTQISSKDVIVSWLPLYHDMGLIGSWLTSFYYAAPIVIFSPLAFLSRPERWLWAIHYHRGTLSGAPNFAYELCIRRINEAQLAGLDLSSWRLSFNGAEGISPRTLENFTKKFEPFGYKPETMYPVYGLAENSVALTFPPLNQRPIIDRVDRDRFQKEGNAVKVDAQHKNALEFVGCGSALPGHQVRILDEAKRTLPDRQVGVVHFRGPSSMMGYYRRPKATQAINYDGWWNTGDLAYQAEGHIFITGRKKDIIIKAGRNLHPEEIEEVTAQINGVRKGCVVSFGVIDPKLGTEKMVIVAESREEEPGIRRKIKAEINEKISTVLGIVPDEILLVSPHTIPKTSSGKLQRSATKEGYLNHTLLGSHIPVTLQIVKLYFKGLFIKMGRGLGMVGKFLYTLYAGILSMFAFVAVLVAVLILPYNYSSRFIRGISKITLTLMGCPIKVEDFRQGPIPKAVVYVANHASYFDAIALTAILPTPVQFVAKVQLFKVPILRTILTKMRVLDVDRVDFVKNMADTDKIVKRLEQGNAIVIFPEGTFTYATGLRPFKLGAFKIAAKVAAPICPVAISGTRDIQRGENFLLKPGKITVTIGEYLIPTSSQWDEVTRLHAQARAFIMAHCGELMIDY